VSLTPDDRLRAQELKHSDQELKLALVRELIVELRWDTHAVSATAAIWGMSPSEVHKLSSLAHNLILSAMVDPNELRAALIAKIGFVSEDALRKKKPFIDKTGSIVLAPDPDHKSALAGLALIAKIAGVEGRPPNEDDYSKKSLDELLNIAKKKLLPQGQPRGITNDKQSRSGDPDEILTTGEESNIGAGVQAAHNQVSESGAGFRGSPGQERVRGRGSRGDRDPTGLGRGRRPEGE
jgi:hypothetical protein